jgi:hypothetical protein
MRLTGIFKKPGLWIRIDSIRIGIRIQQFSSIRIRIQKVIESGYNPDPDTDPDPQQNRYFRRQNFFKDLKILPVIIKILDGHGDVVIRREEEPVSHLAGILLASWLRLRVGGVESNPAPHLGPVQARHHPVHNVL